MRAALVAAALSVVLGVALGPTRARAEAAPPPVDEVDHLALAAVLVRDGAWDRAAAALEAVDPAVAGVDRARYHTLRGVVALQQGAHALAGEQLEAAVDAGQRDPLVHVFLAQARFGVADYRGALAALDDAGAAAADLAGAFLLRAQAHWRLDDRPAAWAALTRGLAHRPDDRELARQRFLLLVDLGLFQAAAAEGAAWLDRADAGPDDSVAIAEALRRGGDPARAARLLEEARLHFPASTAVARQLARAYVDAGQPYAAGLALEPRALVDGALALEVAELYRRAGHLHRALRWNARVPDPPAKARQRLGLLIELGREEEAAALVPRLERLGLLADDEVAYAAAFACYRAGRFDEADRLLAGVADRDVFARAMELRRAMDACRGRIWTCTL